MEILLTTRFSGRDYVFAEFLKKLEKHMSKFEDTCNDAEIECPYCGYSYQPECEDYTDDEREKECEECGKKFYYHQEYTVVHRAKPNCELNKVPHNFHKTEFKDGSFYHICTICGKFQSAKELGEIA